MSEQANPKVIEGPVIEVEAPRRLPAHANCGNCFYGKLEPGPDGKLNLDLRTCYRFPPSGQTVFQAVQTPLGPRQSMQHISLFPPVQSKARCHEWAPQDRDELVLGHVADASGKAN